VDNLKKEGGKILAVA